MKNWRKSQVVLLRSTLGHKITHESSWHRHIWQIHEVLVHPEKAEKQRPTRTFISLSLRCEKGLVTNQPARIVQNKFTTTTSPETLLSSFSVGHLLLGMGLSLKCGSVHSETPLGENQLFLWDQILEIVSGTKPGPLQEQPMLWTTELFLQFLFASFYKWHSKAYKWKLWSFVFSKPSLFETLLLAIARVSTR